MDKKKIAFYTIGDQSLPSTWFRIVQYFPALREARAIFRHYGLSSGQGSGLLGMVELFRQAVIRWWQLRDASNYDLIVLQKGLTFWRCRGLAERLLSSKVPFIVDIDDSVSLRAPIQLPRPLRWLQDEEELAKLFRGARHIVAGNRFLEESVRGYGTKVTVIPTPIDTEKYRVPSKDAKKKTIVGWSGSSATNHFANLAIPILNELAKRHEFEFLIISNDLNRIEVSKLKDVEFKFIRWRKETEVEDLQKIDIGIMPLSNDVWSKGKCGLKALQYMALGAPAVCSRVGINCEIVQDGFNGFLADNQEEWISRLSRLLENPSLRMELGTNARRTVEEKYSVKANVPRLMAVIEKGLENGKSE